MYNPLPHLPRKFQKLIHSLKARKINHRLIFFTLGILSTIWFLVRVIPKPSRAAYPCMQATAPFMSGFVLYLMSLGGALIVLKSMKSYFAKSKYLLAILFMGVAVVLYLFSQTQLTTSTYANKTLLNFNNFPPNDPIGEATGIFPGRVVWMWDPDATNENCMNTSNNNGVMDAGDDAWFMDVNNDLDVIDSMMVKTLLSLTGETDNTVAWDKIFTYYNTKNGYGNVGYSSGQKIMIKINATTAYGGIAAAKYYADLSRNDNLAVNDFASETNPYLVLSMLHQLVDVANIPGDMIYIGDPARNIYKEFYDLWHTAFPDVHYFGNNLIHPELDIVSLGRTPVVITDDDKVVFSDNGTVMPDAVTDKLFTIYESMDYFINIPTMKAHSAGGITLAAKNHFGSFTRDWAMHLHNGLMGGSDDPTRLGYGLYRVQTDIMMHNLLCGKTLLIIVDALYPGEDALGVPFKWTSIPFENDWCSSIFMSLDPVAIESVCHDFLRTEYNGPSIAESRPNWFGVDDYLHQAADSSLWPEDVIYDPDNDGMLVPSLGVHEHWNDSLNKQYTRNLQSGDGIELIKAHEVSIGIADEMNPLNIKVYPNPATDYMIISNSENTVLEYFLTDMNGKPILSGKINAQTDKQIRLTHVNNGMYVLSIQNANKKQSIKIVKR